MRLVYRLIPSLNKIKFITSQQQHQKLYYFIHFIIKYMRQVRQAYQSEYQKVVSSTHIIYQPKVLTFTYCNEIKEYQIEGEIRASKSFQRQNGMGKKKSQKMNQVFKNFCQVNNRKRQITLIDKVKPLVRPVKKKISLVNISKKEKEKGKNLNNSLQQGHKNINKLYVTQRIPKMSQSNNSNTPSNNKSNKKINQRLKSQSFFTNFSLQLCSGCDDGAVDEENIYFQTINPRLIESKFIVMNRQEFSPKNEQKVMDFMRNKKIEETLTNLNEISRSRQKIFSIKLNGSLNQSLNLYRRSGSKNRNPIFSPYKSKNKSTSLDRSQSIRKRIFAPKNFKINTQSQKQQDSPITLFKKSQQKIPEQEIPAQVLQIWKKLQSLNEELISFKDSCFNSKAIE